MHERAADRAGPGQPEQRAAAFGRWWLAVLVGVVIVLGAGCEGGATSTWTVTTAADGSAADPGDGVCEMTPGLGDCSLRAALAEASATSVPTTIVVPSATYVLDAGLGPLVVDADHRVVILGSVDGVTIDAAGASSALDASAPVLIAGRLSFTGATGAGLNIGAGTTAAIINATSHGNDGAGIDVATTATANLVNVTLSDNDGPGVHSAGTTVASYSTVTYNGTNGIAGSGSVGLTASIVAHHPGDDCTAAVTSGGHNIAGDASCALTHSADQPTTAPLLAPLDGGLLPVHQPLLDSPAIDAIPAGTAPCATPNAATVDALDTPRPVGSACDIGAVEADHTLDLTVTDPGDGGAVDPTGTACETTAGAGDCTLRAAVDLVNARTPAAGHTITLATDVTLGLAGSDEDGNATGDIDLHTDVTIDGNGHSLDAAGLDRALHIHGAEVTIGELTVTGGDTSANGGGVLAGPGSDLALDNATITGNHAGAWGGGLHVEGGVASIGASTVSHNEAEAGGGLSGQSADVTVTGSTFAQNAALEGGGGIFETEGKLTVNGSLIVDNQIVGGFGGGIFQVQSSLIMDDSTVAGNDAGDGDGGGLGLLEVEAYIHSSTIADNTAANGGGILAYFGPIIDIRNSTVSGNEATSSNPGIEGAQPGTIIASTIVDNMGPGGVQDSHAISWWDDDYVPTIAASIIQSPSGFACVEHVVSLGFNLASDDSCGLSHPTDLASTQPLLGALGDNGGPTFTHLPYTGSPAIGAIPIGTPGFCDGTLPTDQRGESRPSGSACDIGAVEGFDPTPLVPLDVVVDAAHDAPDANPGDGICDDGTGACTLRAAIDETNTTPTADTITIAPGINPVLTIAGTGDNTNASGDLDILRPLTINGGGAEVAAMNGDRVLHLLPAVDISISDLVITGGVATNGAAILSSADLTLDGVHLEANSASANFTGVLHALMGTLAVRDSSIVDNIGHGMYLSYLVDGTVESSTIAANSRDGVRFASITTTLLLEQVTVSGNGELGLWAGGNTTVRSSTVADNAGGEIVGFGAGPSVEGSILGYEPSTDPVCSGAVQLGNHNLVSDTTCGAGGTNTSVDTLPLLSPLGDNGGPTLTHLPYANSPVVDAIAVGTPGLCDGRIPVDQRGEPRPQGAGCDIGAVEGTDTSSLEPLELTVDAAHDAPDANPGDGTCDDGTGACTLRAAIDETNTTPTTDTITIAPGINPVLTIAGGDDTNTAGDLDIHRPLTINGGGATLTATHGDRALHLHPWAIEVTISGLAITGGQAANGGALASVDVDVTISDSTFTDNEATSDGGALHLAGGSLVLSDSTVVDNAAGRHGAGLHGTSAEVTVTLTTFESNQATSRGGAMHLASTQSALGSVLLASNSAGTDGGGIRQEGGALTVDDTTITGNLASTGGGLSRSSGTTTVIDTTFVANEASGSGGGIRTTGGTTALSDSEVSGNQAGGGGGISTERGSTTIERTLVAGNIATNGGGLSISGGIFSMVESDVSDNHAIPTGPFTAGIGGGIRLAWSSAGFTVDIDRSTIRANQARNGAGIAVNTTRPDHVIALRSSTVSGNHATGNGGGLWNERGLPVLEHVTVVENTAPFGAQIRTTPDDASTTTSLRATVVGASTEAIDACVGPIQSEGFNAAVDTSCGLTDATDVVAPTMLLGPLADNGGPTRTHLPYANSPVVDAIPAGTPGLCDGTIAVDQRGEPRPQGAGCDIGAVEGTNADPLAPLDLVVDAAHDAPDANPGDGTCDDGTGACTLRAAVDETNATLTADTITIGPGVNPVLTITGIADDTNTTGDLDIHRPLTIHGGGAVVTAAHGDRALHIHTTTATITHLTVQGGQAATGSALSTEPNSVLHLEQTTLSGNGPGPALSHAGTSLIVDASTVSDNAGDGITTTGAGSQFELTNSTMSGNGGAGLRSEGTTTLRAATLVDNDAHQVVVTSGALTTSASVLGSAIEPTVTCVGSIQSAGFNAAVDTSCGLDQPTDLISATMLLGPLADNGGPTLTHLPYANSPVVDSIAAGTPGLCDGTIAVDQRGEARPDGTGCDIGAVEGASPDALAPLDLVVDAAHDAPDANPGDGTCDDGTGACTLRAAIDETNATLTADTITIAPGINPVLTITGIADDTNTTGDLDIHRPVTIDGGGAQLTAAHGDRVLHIHTTTATIADLTISGGRAQISGSSSGGAILADSPMLTIDDVTFVDNRAIAGGAISLGAGALHLQDSTFLENRAWAGGALTLTDFHNSNATISHSHFEANHSTFGGALSLINNVTIEHSHFEDNHATDNGGAIQMPSGDLVVTESTLTGNTAGIGGGGLYAGGNNDQTIVIQHGVLENNHAGARGGAILSAGLDSGVMPVTLSVDHTVIRNNSAGTNGGGIRTHSVTHISNSALADNQALDNGGGISQQFSPLSVTASSFVGNVAGNYGGGLWTDDDATVTSTTFSGNEAGSSGGAVHNSSRDLWLVASTLVGNNAPNGGGIRASGPWNDEVRLLGTIITGSGSGCFSMGGIVISLGFNLASDDTCSLDQPTDLANTDPLLGPLADNGGPTLTHLPDATSPAVDAIAPGTPDLCDGTLAVDQRGVARPQGAGCDIGAVER